MGGDPTKLDHYESYPVCGFCVNAWDIVYQRRRALTSPEQWLGYCKVNGCDPDIWDYINLTTHWPKGWKVFRESGIPNWKKLPAPPPFDDRVYHRRESDGQNAKWRKVMNTLSVRAQERKADRRMIDPVDLAEWDEDASDPAPALLVADLDDDDLW